MDMKVSVCMITYKHEKYIAQAIDGVLKQKVNFDLELVIADDCSPDGTDEIVKKYIHTHPKGHCIKYYKHKNNIGMLPNFMFALQQCKGKYIAFCDGDDYWADSIKLQKQVCFLEANPDYGLIYTDYEIDSNGKIIKSFLANMATVPTGLIFKDLCRINYIATLTVCVRQGLLLKWANEILKEAIDKKWKMGDYPVWLQGALESKFAYLPDKTGMYRILTESASHASDEIKQFEFLKSTYEIQRFFIDREGVDAEIKKDLECAFYSHLLQYSIRIGDRKKASEAYKVLRMYSWHPSAKKQQLCYWAAKYGIIWLFVQIAKGMSIIKL